MLVATITEASSGQARRLYRHRGPDAPMLLEGSRQMLGYWEHPLEVFEWACAQAGFALLESTYTAEGGSPQGYDELLEGYFEEQDRPVTELDEVEHQVGFLEGRIVQALADGVRSIALLFAKGLDGRDPTEEVKRQVRSHLEWLGYSITDTPSGTMVSLEEVAPC